MYNSQKSGITSAIVICILLPLGICAFCLVVKLRERGRERGGGDGDGPAKNNSDGRKSVGQRFGAIRSSGSSGRKGNSDSDRDSGFHANGKVTVANNRNNSDEDVRYNSERFQRKANLAEKEDSLKGGIVRGSSKAESYSGSKGSSVSDLLDLDSPLPPASRNRGGNSKKSSNTNPSLEDVVRHRPPVTRLPSSSGRSTPSSPSSPTSNPEKPFPAKPATTASSVPTSRSNNNINNSNNNINNNFQPQQPIRGSGRSASSDRLLNENRKPDSLPILNQLPLGNVPRQPVSAKSSSASSNFQPQQPIRGSGRSTASSDRSANNNNGGGAIPKSFQKKGPGSLTSSSASSPPPPLPTTLPPPITTDDSEDETDVSPSDFDGVYYTNEPLVDKPRVEFPAKTMETEIDIKNYKPFVAPNKKPSAL